MSGSRGRRIAINAGLAVASLALTLVALDGEASRAPPTDPELEEVQELQRLVQSAEIYDTILKVVQIAQDKGIPTYRAADRLAEERNAEAAAKKKK